MSQNDNNGNQLENIDRNNRGNFTRNLNKEEDYLIARKMFFGGLALLPWLWAVNAIFYRKHIFDSTLDTRVTIWVRRSCLGFCIVTILLLGWIINFQCNWKKFHWEHLLMQVPQVDIDNGW